MFIVPMMTTLRGSVNGSALSEEYIRSIASSRYSSRKYNSEENLGEVPAIDLVDNQHEQLNRMLAGAVGQAAHRARFQFEADLTIAVRAGAEAFEEILVAVGRVELHNGDVIRAGEMPSQRLRDVRLPGTGRPVEDQLRAITQQIGAPGQPTEIHMQRVRQLLARIHYGEFRYGRIIFVVQLLVHVVITCTYSKSLALQRLRRLPHRLPRFLVEIDGTVLFLLESAVDLEEVDIHVVETGRDR